MDVRHCKGCDLDMSPSEFYQRHAKCKKCCIKATQEYRKRKQDPEASDDWSEASERLDDDLYVAWNPRIPGELKIGRSRNPKARIAGMSASHNFRMEVVATFPGLGYLEPRVHALLAARRVGDCPGREWFEVSEAFVFAAVLEARDSE
jgi:T5orf172 domain